MRRASHTVNLFIPIFQANPVKHRDRIQSRSRRYRRSIAGVASVMATCLGASAAHALSNNLWTFDAGNNSWNNAGNWLGGNVPGSSDQATVFNTHTNFIQLNATPPAVGGLFLGDTSSAEVQVTTNGFSLSVLGTTDIDNQADLEVQSTSSKSVAFQSPTISLTNGGIFGTSGIVRVSSSGTGTPNGTMSTDADSGIDLYSGGEIDAGTINVNGSLSTSAASATVNTGTLNLGPTGGLATYGPTETTGGSVTIKATTFNLNNSGSTINLGSYGMSLTLNGSPNYTSSRIAASVYVGDACTLTLQGGAWQFGTPTGAGNLNLQGGADLADAATVASYASYAANVNVNGYGVLSTGEFDGGAVGNVSSGSILYLNSPYFRGSSANSTITFGGAGTYEMSGATVIGMSGTGIPYTTVVVNAGAIFDWDGTSEQNASCSITNGELDIYSSTIDVTSTFFQPYGYRGSLNITGGARLNVAGTAWNMYGSMNLSPGAIVAGQTITFDGSHLPAGSYSLYPSFSGTTFPVIQAPVVFNPNTYLYMGFTGGLHLDGATTWNGGAVISAPFVSGNPPYGILVQDGNATVSANTNIFCDVLDMDGTSNTATWTINPGVVFTQQAFYLDSAGSTTNPFHSSLTMNGGTIDMQTSSGVWTLAGGTINMNQININQTGYYPNIVDSKLILGSGATIGTINVGAASSAYINAQLQSGVTSATGGNIINVPSGSGLYINMFGSAANAVLTKTGPGSFTVYGAQTHAAGSQIIVAQGTMNLYSDAGANGANLNINASGGTTDLNTTQHLASLNIGTGASVALTTQSTRSVLVTALNMSGGTLDLANNDAIIHSGNLTTLWQNVQTGYNGGNWNGTGIISSSAHTDTKHLTALGIISNNNGIGQPLFTSFEGQTAIASDVLIKYTYYGDATLDGSVSSADYTRIDAAFLANHSSGQNLYTGWSNGDFNYDGVINGSDYTLIDNAFNQQGGQIAAEIAGPTAQFGNTITTVPEQSVVVGIAVCATALLSRRNRRPMAAN